MRVTGLTVDSFGILQGQNVEGLSPGVTCFLGRNEAGKSTCLAFFKAMLFGYRRGKTNLDPFYDGKNKKMGGGSLLLHSDSFGPLRLTRTPGKGGGPIELCSYDSQSLQAPVVYTEADLQRLTGNVSTDVFDNIFAFSLKSLMELDSLKGPGVRHALHGAAFGPGLRSPAQVLKELEAGIGKLLKRQAPGSTARINTILDSLAEVTTALKESEPELELYIRLKRELAALDERQRFLLQRNAFFEERLSMVRRMQRLQGQKREREETLQRSEETVSGLRAAIDVIGSPDAVAKLYPAMQSLREQKERRRSEAEELPVLTRKLEDLSRKQQETLASLGPGWDMRKASNADLSLPVHEAVSGFERSLEAAQQRVTNARQACTLLSREAEDAHNACIAAQRAAESVRIDATPLPEAGWFASFTATLSHARNLASQLPGLVERERLTAGKAAKAIADIDPAWTSATLAGFDDSLRSRQQLEQAAAVVFDAKEELAAARRRIPLAEDALTSASERLRSAQDQAALYRDISDRATLAARQSFLRHLERLLLELDVVRRSSEAADSALIDHLSQQRTTGTGTFLRKPLVLAAIFCFLAALPLGLSGYVYAIQTLVYVGAALFGLGCVSLAADLWVPKEKTSADLEQEAALRRSRNETESRKRRLQEDVASSLSDNASWLASTRPDEPEPADLARAAAQLEEQARQLVLKEREEQELAVVERACEAAGQRLREARQEEQAAAGRECEAMAAWQSLLRQHRLAAENNPHMLSGIFDKVTVARALADTAGEAASAKRKAEETIAACFEQARQQPFFIARLGDLSFQGTSPDAAFARLSACMEELREQYEKLKERKQRESILEERSQAKARAAQRLAKAQEDLSTAELEARTDQANWNEWLARHGLQNGLSPRTAAQALQRIDQCKTLATEAQNLSHRRTDIMTALERYENAVLELALQAGMDIQSLQQNIQEMPVGPVRMHQVLQLLDAASALISQAEKARTILLEKNEHLARQLQVMDREKAALQEVDAAINAVATQLQHHTQDENREEDTPDLLEATPEMQVAMLPEDGLEFADALVSIPEMAVDWSDPEYAAQQEEAVKSSLAAIGGQLAGLSEQRGNIIARRQSLAEGMGNAALRGEKSSLQEDLHAQARRWTVLVLARELLLRAKSNFEAQGQVGVIRQAGELFHAITEGEYLNVVAGMDDDTVFARHVSGELRDPEKQLSQGTREQLYLSLRLAYVQNHAAHAESLPVVMDDILVNFDPQRARATAKVLANFARHNQILFFTCHPATANILLEAAEEASREAQAPPARLYTVERGRITAA